MVHNYMVRSVPAQDPIAAELSRQWSASAITLQAQGTNKATMTGILCFVDQPSDLPPGGASGHRVIIPKAVAARKLDSLMGMPINADPAGLADHNRLAIVGSVQRAWLDGNRVMIAGVLWDKNQAALVSRIHAMAGDLGLSYEVADCTVADTAAPIWELTDFEFTGCSILKRTNAAYQSTAVQVAA